MPPLHRPKPKNHPKPKQLKTCLLKYRDANKDGLVSFEEFLAGRTEKTKTLRANFDKRDTNGNGHWEKSEISP